MFVPVIHIHLATIQRDWIRNRSAVIEHHGTQTKDKGCKKQVDATRWSRSEYLGDQKQHHYQWKDSDEACHIVVIQSSAEPCCWFRLATKKDKQHSGNDEGRAKNADAGYDPTLVDCL